MIKLENYQPLQPLVNFQMSKLLRKLQHNNLQLDIKIALPPKRNLSYKDMTKCIELGCALYLDQSIELSGKVPLVTFEWVV